MKYLFLFLLVAGGSLATWELDYFVGTSMSPFLNPGDRVCVETQERYYIGDVIVFRYDKEGYVFTGSRQIPDFLVHRIVATGYRTYYAKGDNNDFEDAPVAWNDVLGKATRCREKHIHR